MSPEDALARRWSPTMVGDRHSISGAPRESPFDCPGCQLYKGVYEKLNDVCAGEFIIGRS